MAQRNETGFITVTTTEAVTAFKAGTLGSTAHAAGLTASGGRVDGFFENDAASGAVVAFRLITSPGTHKAVMATSCSPGDTLYAAASGKLSTAAAGSPVAVAKQASGADGDIIEVVAISAARLPLTFPTEAHVAGDTLTAAESGSIHTNAGAAGTITLVLPAATVGQVFIFRVAAAQELRLDPNGSETISLPSTGVPGAAGKYLVADAIGETVTLFCGTAGSWSVLGYTGTWTAEA